MATTTNFNWSTPDDTALVKDGASAIRTLGSSIDTSFVDLKGGTTGQVLAKASGTDLDFTWATDASGIPATIFDAKGDIIGASAADTAARLAVGANGTVLTADSGETTGLKWAAPASGGMTLLSTTTLSTATTTISGISGSYTNLFLTITGYTSTTANDFLYMAVNGSTTLGTWSYIYSGASSGSGNASKLKLTPVSISDVGTDSVWFINFADYANTSSRKVFGINGVFYGNSASRYDALFGTGVYLSTSAITSLTFSCDGSGMAGTVKIYGVK